MRQPYLAARLQGFGTTIFAEMTALAVEHGAVNLGQGFPDFDGPAEVLEAAVAAIRGGHNQYPPGTGLPELRQAIAEHQRRWYGVEVDPDTEVTVTAGATEAIFATLQALLEVGDEVVCFQPFYDSYQASISMAGAVERPAALRPPDFAVDLDEVASLVSPRTRLLLVNSPNNPTGAVFRRDELEGLAELCVRHDLLAVTDEVYEHLVYDGEHVPLATLPGMRERTVTISSAAKTFSVTGWKVGWAVAPPPLTAALRTAKQFVTFTNAGPFQPAVATALRLPDAYFDDLCTSYRARRDRLVAGLSDVGFEAFPPAGTYFVTADVRPLGHDDGWEFCRQLPARAGVVAVPTEVFYRDRALGRHLVRFAFCKSDALLDEAIARLGTLR